MTIIINIYLDGDKDYSPFMTVKTIDDNFLIGIQN